MQLLNQRKNETEYSSGKMTSSKMKNNKVVLAFSGGLDTSFCAWYLKNEMNLEVHAITVNTGGFSDAELLQIRKRAHELGVASYTAVDQTQAYYNQIIRNLIFGNVLKNGTYPLSVSAERVVQAMAVAEYVNNLDAAYVAHGSTGAGNDQVRFDMIFQVVCPGAEILTPIRDLKLSREEEIEKLRHAGIQWDFAKNQYSINKGLWGTSVGGKETLKSLGYLPEEAFPTQVSETEPREVTIEFEQGEPVAVDGKSFKNPVDAIQYLQTIAGPFGIGRDIHVGDTIIGIKGRVGFEAAAPVLLIKAHHTLEKHTLTKWQLFWKDQLAQFYGNWLHEGQYFDPAMRDIEAFFKQSQERVTGAVHIRLHPYRFEILGIKSPFDLMSDKFGSYGEMNRAWSGEDVRGFAKMFANSTSIWQKIGQQAEMENLKAEENA